MNKTYRVVWNESTNTWVAVAEIATARGKSGKAKVVAIGVKAAAKLTASVAALYLVGTTSAYASPGIYINDGTDPSCQAISDSTNWGGLYTIYRGEKIQYINGGYVPANVDPTLDYFNIKSTNNPCSSVGAAAQHHNTQTNRTLFYGSNGAATDADNGAKNLTLGGRLDVNSGIIGVGNQGTNGAGATYSIRMGKGSMLSAENDNSTAISIGVGDDYNRAGAKGSGSIAIGYNALAEGNNSSIAIGNSAKAGHALSLAIGTLASTADGKAGTVALGYAAKGQDENATAIGYQAEAAKGGSVLGQGSKATAEDAVALGRGSNASLQNAVALGTGSTTGTNASKVDSATVGSVTYGGGTNAFAGSAGVDKGDQVSIGSAGNERQIKHVAPGEINANSTDAINGSQLFHITQGLQGQIAAAGANGVHFYHVNGANTDNNYNNDGATGSKALAAGINAKAAGASSVAVGSAEVAAKSVVGQSNSEGAVAVGDSAYAAGRQAVTLGASRAEEEQAVAIGSNARSSGKASMAIGADAVASQENSISIGSSANAAGNNSVSIGADSSTVAAAAGSVALGHTSQATRAAIDATKVQANAAPTVANNQVYALASASNADQNNITATVKGALGAVSVGTQNGTRQIINVAAGTEDSDAVNVAQLKAVANQITTQAVATTPLTVANDGKVTPPAAADAGKLVTAGDIANAINSSGFKATAGGNTTGAAPTEELIKAGDTLTLKAGSGLTVEQSGSTFTYALNAQQITQNAQTPVVYTKADSSKVYKHTDGNFYDQPNGAGTQVAAGDVIASMQGADGATTATPATKDPDTGIMTMAGGTTLNNVASAGDITNPANAYRAVNAGDLNNSVQKLVNNGFKIDADNGTVDTVKLGETVKYAGDGNIVTTVSNNQIGFKLANTVTVGDAATGGKPVKIDGTTGNVTGLTNITWDPANTPITSGRAATEDQLLAVANAANSAGAGFTIAGNSKAAGVTTADETIKAGETLSIKGTGTGAFTDYDSSNIQTQVGANGEVTVGLKKDLTVNSVTAGNTKVDNNGITINNPADPSKNVSLSGNGLNNGGNTITNVGDGVADTDAVNVRQLKAAQTNVNNLTNNVIGTDKPNITTYDVHGNVADNQNTVVEAINNMNTGGIKFFHVNDGTGTQNTAGTLSHPEDSSAKGNYGAAVGYQAKADGENSVAMGKGAQAMGTNTISIGTGNVVTGNNSGAIGDPTTITGSGTYTIGNNNGVVSANNAGAFGNNNTLTGDNSRIIGNSSTVTTTDTFVMGNNSTSNVANSVVLGSNAAATSAATASSAGTTTYASSVINGTTYNYAGATPTGVVSVGDVGKERRVQNVAAGLISADSTDAINGSQLYATNSAINALQTGAAGIVQYSNGGTQPNGGAATNHVTLVGGNQNAPVTVHNVAAGVAPTDAVNVSQLQGVAGQIGKVADEADAGTAAAMAAAGLPQAYLPGKSMVAVSGSTYRGKQGYAVGFSAINDGGNWIVKGIATGNSKGKFGATIGAGYQW